MEGLGASRERRKSSGQGFRGRLAVVLGVLLCMVMIGVCEGGLSDHEPQIEEEGLRDARGIISRFVLLPPPRPCDALPRYHILPAGNLDREVFAPNESP